MLHRTLALSTALALLAAVGQAATPSPTVPVYKCAVDFRRASDCDLIVTGSWVDPFTLAPGATISLTTPVSDSSIYAAYSIGPLGGDYGLRNMGEGHAPQVDTPTAIGSGTAWQKNLAEGVLAPTASGARWVAITNLSGGTLTGTVSWASMVGQ